MNTMESCDRFEREGILRIERGLALDMHFDECPTCEVARQKYDTLLAALPSGQPDVVPPSGWQLQVLQAAAKKDSSRSSFSLGAWRRPFVWTAMAGAAAMAVASFAGVSPGPQFEVQAETHAAASSPDMANDTEEPSIPITGDRESIRPEPVAPQPIAPKVAPRQPTLIAQQATQKPEESWFPSPEPAKPAPPPVTNPVPQSEAIQNSGPASPPTRHVRVIRPDKLYGLNIKYPHAAMQAKIQGETSVMCTIRADGRNTNCKILKGLPYLDSAVIRAVEAARSEPIRVDGKAVDNSDHIWHITITLREIVDDRTSARGLPTVNWN
ncbi:MAG TPA: TonB family protein [Polyangium sp.]|nr:TonB family protein [Polyangium sp.]